MLCTERIEVYLDLINKERTKRQWKFCTKAQGEQENV